MSDLKFRIKAESLNPTKTKIKARNFEFLIDEPEDLGGTNDAANPVEYLLGAYAGCLNVVGHLIAKEMGFTLENLKISISGTLNPAKLFGQSDDERAGYKSIEVKFTPTCDQSEEIMQQWMEEVCRRCPVSDNIKNITPIETKLKLAN